MISRAMITVLTTLVAGNEPPSTHNSSLQAQKAHGMVTEAVLGEQLKARPPPPPPAPRIWGFTTAGHPPIPQNRSHVVGFPYN